MSTYYDAETNEYVFEADDDDDESQTFMNELLSKARKATVTELDKKIHALSLLPKLSKDREWLKSFIAVWDVSVPLSVAVRDEWVSKLSDKGIEEIEKCFSALAETIGQPEPEVLKTISEAYFAE